MRALIFLAAGLLIGQTPPEPLSKTYRVTRANDVEFQKIEPFKVFDNLYYVGPGYAKPRRPFARKSKKPGADSGWESGFRGKGFD